MPSDTLGGTLARKLMSQWETCNCFFLHCDYLLNGRSLPVSYHLLQINLVNWIDSLCAAAAAAARGLSTFLVCLGEVRPLKCSNVWEMSLRSVRLLASLRHQPDRELIVETNERQLIKYSVFHAVENVFIWRNSIYSLIADAIKTRKSQNKWINAAMFPASCLMGAECKTKVNEHVVLERLRDRVTTEGTNSTRAADDEVVDQQWKWLRGKWEPADLNYFSGLEGWHGDLAVEFLTWGQDNWQVNETTLRLQTESTVQDQTAVLHWNIDCHVVICGKDDRAMRIKGKQLKSTGDLLRMGARVVPSAAARATKAIRMIKPFILGF